MPQTFPAASERSMPSRRLSKATQNVQTRPSERPAPCHRRPGPRGPGGRDPPEACHPWSLGPERGCSSTASKPAGPGTPSSVHTRNKPQALYLPHGIDTPLLRDSRRRAVQKSRSPNVPEPQRAQPHEILRMPPPPSTPCPKAQVPQDIMCPSRR
ncbi:hypothetical protein RhiirA5_445811 [Rhizophagus irregularis]|uniref:Uncharacterized protein n=1 Tax=Rhizophagus irregularis TaxID=588596 RepID=A0A2N0NC69_9GLOM|nr:hypothetical protein RhiirA5_445811 [Rhizophagus irregularis]